MDMSTSGEPPRSRGWFAIGAERISKPMNLGALLRTAHAFGAAFAFVIDPEPKLRAALAADTSRAADAIPVHDWPDVAAMRLPRGCRLVGVELVEGATLLPSFRHPPQAAYVLGSERGELSAELLARCDHVVRIPTRFCVNLSVAGAIVMYDRLLTMGRFAERPVATGARPVPLPAHVHGRPQLRGGP